MAHERRSCLRKRATQPRLESTAGQPMARTTISHAPVLPIGLPLSQDAPPYTSTAKTNNTHFEPRTALPSTLFCIEHPLSIFVGCPNQRGFTPHERHRNHKRAAR